MNAFYGLGMVVLYVLAMIGLAQLLFPKTKWREDDPCGRS